MNNIIRIPKHVAIIMDGNGRWAMCKGLSRAIGHLNGARKISKVVRWFFEYGVDIVTLWAFSTDNWKRSEQEVHFILNLFKRYTKRILNLMYNGKTKYRIKCIGNIHSLGQEIEDMVNKIENGTKDNKKTVVIAFNYNGYWDILSAVNRIINDKIKEVDKDIFSSYLSTADIPDPDLLVRTSGEKRISNFMPWQTAYSEIIFLDNNWPDFNRNNVLDILMEYDKRDRRYGGY